MNRTKTVVGLLDTRYEAQSVVDDLTRSGFNREDISMVSQGEKEEFTTHEPRGTTSDKQVEGVTKGVGAGAAIGGVGGLLIGIAGFAIPGIGPIVAAGPIATALAGAGVGAVAGGLVGALTNMGVPEEEAHYYEEGVRRGGVLVTVATDDAGADKAADIMRRHGAVDIDKRAKEWKSTGWSPYEESQRPRTSGGRLESEGVFPVVEEDVKVGKRQAEEGRTRVHKETTEMPFEEEISLREQHAKVERRSADRPLSAAEEEEAFREQSFDISETREEPVVSKEARVKEEVVVGREERERTEKIREQARRTDVHVEHEGARTGLGSRERLLGPDDEDFRNHFRSTYSRTGEEKDFQNYREAYAYGAEKSRDLGYQAIDWNQIENEIRRDWEIEHPGTWNMYKEAIHYGWEKEASHH
jgi:stress response protein YsnF